MIPIKCRMGQCLKMQVGRKGYCEEHLSLHNKEKFKEWQKRRGDSVYNDHRYRCMRINVLNEHPLCQDCNKRASQDIHHIVKVKDDPSRLSDDSNVLALCKRCHGIRTDRGE